MESWLDTSGTSHDSTLPPQVVSAPNSRRALPLDYNRFLREIKLMLLTLQRPSPFHPGTGVPPVSPRGVSPLALPSRGIVVLTGGWAT